MGRIDREPMDAAKDAVTIRIPTRYDDLDTHGHVNSAAATVILQEARAEFIKTIGASSTVENLNIVVAAVSVAYAGEIHCPALIEVSVGVLRIGRSAVTFWQVARQEGIAKLYAEAVLVFTGSDGPASIPDTIREAYTRASL